MALASAARLQALLLCIGICFPNHKKQLHCCAAEVNANFVEPGAVDLAAVTAAACCAAARDHCIAMQEVVLVRFSRLPLTSTLLR